MQSRRLVRLRGLVLALIFLAGGVTSAVTQSLNRIAYWRTTYQELKPKDDPRAAKAHAIFERLVQVAGKRPWTVPRLYIIADEPWDMSLPIAIQDGWIILSKGVLERCYRHPKWGDDRLAFILAHELAHQLQDDLWHIRFFEALKGAVSPEFLSEIQRGTNETSHVLARELQADEHGIIYAAMAGFNTQAIVSGNHDVNFFTDWVQALDPRRIIGVPVDRRDSTAQRRAEALRAALRRVGDETVAFQAGLWFYYAGNYPQAIRAFDHFRTVFPSREVHHNLAVSHHQLALQAYRKWQPKAQTFPFHLSLAIEPLTLASQIYLGRTRGLGNELTRQFHQHLKEAIRWYREALSQDATYTPAALNLGAAFVLRGVHAPKPGLHPDFAEAISILSRALEHAPQSAELLNNLGVALFYDERAKRAQTTLTQARTLAPAYAAPVFNLAMMARAEQRDAEARRYQRLYQTLAPPATRPSSKTNPREETVAGVIPGAVQKELPARWGKPARGIVQLDGTHYTLATYPVGIMTLAQDGEILMIRVQAGFRETSARGIQLGNRADYVLARYGPPSRRHSLPHGGNWAYDAQRIAFQLRAGQVVSWLRY